MAGKGVRVTGGGLCGRRLRIPQRGVRPTTDRVRESLFARLGDMTDAVVLDLYAGSGVLGIEAVSRGARRVVFVERAEGALAVLRDNLATLCGGADTRVLRGDAARKVRQLGREGERFDLVFLDPPYASDELARVLGALSEAALLEPGGSLVAEHGRRHPLPHAAEWEPRDEWAYGETQVTRLAAARQRDAGGSEV